jgi:hypothetical protein
MVTPKSAVVSYFDLNLRAASAAPGDSNAAACRPPALSEDLVGPAISTGKSDVEAHADTEKRPQVSPTLRTPVPATSKKSGAEEGLTFLEAASTFDSTKASPVKPMSLAEQLLMYFGVVIGVVFSTVVQQFRSGQVLNLQITLGGLLVAAVIALVIVPVVFQKLTVRPDAPFLVRFGLFVQNGVFWHVLTSSIGKSFAG